MCLPLFHSFYNCLTIAFTITFIYTTQIQLYSFQMRLTIKGLKIYLTIKDLKIYHKKQKLQTLQHYIRKGFFKKVSLQITFKNLKIRGASNCCPSIVPFFLQLSAAHYSLSFFNPYFVCTITKPVPCWAIYSACFRRMLLCRRTRVVVTNPWGVP